MGDVEDKHQEFVDLCLERDCRSQHTDYLKCLDRIKDLKPDQEPHCWGWYGEVIHCVDSCVYPKHWPTLK